MALPTETIGLSLFTRRTVDRALLVELAAELDASIPSAVVVTERERAERVATCADALLNLEDGALEGRLAAFELELPGGARRARREVLRRDAHARATKALAARDGSERERMLEQAARDYGVAPEAWSPSSFRTLADGEPFHEGYALVREAAEEASGRAVVRAPRRSSLRGADEVLKVAVDVGGNGLAGAVIAQVLEAVVGWCVRRRREGRPVPRTITIYGPDGEPLKTIVVDED